MAGAVGAELAADTRHPTLWLQVVGKIRIARTPLLNHWWKAPLHLTSRGLTTSLMPGETGGASPSTSTSATIASTSPPPAPNRAGWTWHRSR